MCPRSRSHWWDSFTLRVKYSRQSSIYGTLNRWYLIRSTMKFVASSRARFLAISGCSQLKQRQIWSDFTMGEEYYKSKYKAAKKELRTLRAQMDEEKEINWMKLDQVERERDELAEKMDQNFRKNQHSSRVFIPYCPISSPTKSSCVWLFRTSNHMAFEEKLRHTINGARSLEWYRYRSHCSRHCQLQQQS